MLSRFLQELRLLVGPDFRLNRYLLAVSGGADSTVMGSLFHDAGLTFAVAHCNFHLRGEDSNRDMLFVENLATQWRAPILIRDFDTLTIQQNSGKSVEMVARDLRYSWFRELSTDFDSIVVAHNCTDNAGTQLLNLCRGTGLKGLCGIPPVNGKIIRPLLAFTSREIRQYAEKQGIAHVEDYTNMDESISRNRIRHSVLPQLECINPQFLAKKESNRHIMQRQ